MKKIRKIFFNIFKCYRRLELVCVPWEEGNRLIMSNSLTKDTTKHWVIAKEEDENRVIGMVWLERKERITL